MTDTGLAAKVSMLRPVLTEVLEGCHQLTLVESLAADVARLGPDVARRTA